MSGDRVAVVGGGLAGTTAALACADAGAQVVLYESRTRLGGLAGSTRRGGLEIDTGQHVVLRCCHAYRALLARLGVADLVALQPRLDIPVLSPGRPPARLRRHGRHDVDDRRAGWPSPPAPLHLAGALARYTPVPWRERASLVRAALALRRVDPADPAVDRRSFGDWLAEHGQGPRAVAALWDLVGTATLNAPAADASLALAATVFREGLLTDPAAADIGVPTVPLGRLHDVAARAALAAAGVEVRLGARVTGIAPRHGNGTGGWTVAARGRTDTVTTTGADAVVCALPPDAAARVLPEPVATTTAASAAGLGHAPIVDVHVVYDRPVLDEPFAAALDSPVEWVFDRTGGGDGLPPGAQYLVVSLSAADDRVGTTTAALRAEFLPALARLLPRAGHARVLDSFVTREPRATFRARPGQAALRPGAATALLGLALAGTWTDTGWPATMEGAVRSGVTAARVVRAAPDATTPTNPTTRAVAA